MNEMTTFEKSIVLYDGPGTVEIKIKCAVFDLTERDRAFVFTLINAVNTYEATHSTGSVNPTRPAVTSAGPKRCEDCGKILPYHAFQCPTSTGPQS